jgi:hypothetical protein
MKCLLVLATVLVATIAATPQASPDETAVRNIIQEEITAWNSGDAAAYSRHFAADGTFTNIRGEFFTGRQPFIQKHDNDRRPSHRKLTFPALQKLPPICFRLSCQDTAQGRDMQPERNGDQLPYRSRRNPLLPHRPS